MAEANRTSIKKIKGDISTQIKTKCTDKVLKLSNIIAIVGLGIGAFLRFLWCFGVGSGSITAVVVAEAPAAEPAPAPAPTPAPEPPADGGRRLQAAGTTGGFGNFCFLFETLYLMSFIAIVALNEFKQEHKFG